jgi:pimeloyl-ACP methyl ester carboxylesterase
MVTATSADGTDIRAVDEGTGPIILVLPPGMDDGRSWEQVATQLAPTFRVVRLHRRQYRMDLSPDAPISIAQEVEDVLALTGQLGGPVLLVGHSSGGVVALEAMAAAPTAFSGAVIYEAPVVVGGPLGGAALERARAAAAAGQAARAMTIYLRDIVRMNPVLARLSGIMVAGNLGWRERMARQLDDTAAIDQLGDRLETYAAIDLPVVLLAGSRSPAHLGERTAALAGALPKAEVVTLNGLGHDAHTSAPEAVASVIEAHADTTMR